MSTMNSKAGIASEITAFPAGEELTLRCEVEPAHASDQLFSGDRRSLLGILTGLIGLGITSLLGVTLGRFSIVPALAATSVSEWIDVAPIETLPDGKAKNQLVLVSQNAGWGRFTSEQSVWVIKRGAQLNVFSSVCPHLGCTINENSNGFGCVCHNSAWTREGETSGGPAPRGMDRLEHKVEDGILKVKYQSFKQGLAQKVVTS
jgi:Rieske Fe-S protein